MDRPIGTWRKQPDGKKWHYWPPRWNDQIGGSSHCNHDHGFSRLRVVRPGNDVPPRDEICEFCAAHTGQPKWAKSHVLGPDGWSRLTDQQRRLVQQLINQLRPR